MKKRKVTYNPKYPLKGFRVLPPEPKVRSYFAKKEGEK